MNQADETLPLGDQLEAWNRLADVVRAFTDAWYHDGNPPPIGKFLPTEPAGLRHLVLIELIKVDLRQRWTRQQGELLEYYLREFPELSIGGDLTCDLIFEEYQVRLQSGDAVTVNDYLHRFPSQADSLRRVMTAAIHTHTASLVPAERPDAFAAGQKVDDFDLLVPLGKGAFASVFLARQISMQRLVALKISADRGQEPQTLAQLDHPHIVRVYDQRTLPDGSFKLLYMQYISGGTVQDVVDEVRITSPPDRTGKLMLDAIDQNLDARGDSPPTDSSLRRFLAGVSWPEAVCWLGARLAEALSYAHQQGVLHRDVKPANVLLSSDGSPKLADFNVSFSSKLEGATAAAYMGGSLAYMSPEQLEACDPQSERPVEDLDGRSDVYSLSVMLWELLTGRRPFVDVPMQLSWTEMLRKLAAQRREGLPRELAKQLPSDCPPGLVEALLRGLEPDRDRRVRSASQMARQLQLCLQPSVQTLLRPRGKSLLARVRQHPILSTCIAGLAPNVICSLLNISYNFQEIIRELQAAHALDVFYRQLAIINPIAFGLGLFVAVRYGWPLFRAVRHPEKLTFDETLQLQRRALSFGDVVAGVSGSLWWISGIAFPVWLHLEVGDTANLGWSQHLHFFTSQVLCGMLASTQTFFLISTLSLHAFFPALVRPEQDNSAALEWLRKLLNRAGWMFYLAVSVPLLSIFAVMFADVRNPAPFGILAALGLGSFILSYRLFSSIQRDVETLAVAVSPMPEGGTLSTSSSLIVRQSRR